MFSETCPMSQLLLFMCHHKVIRSERCRQFQRLVFPFYHCFCLSDCRYCLALAAVASVIKLTYFLNRSPETSNSRRTPVLTYAISASGSGGFRKFGVKNYGAFRIWETSHPAFRHWNVALTNACALDVTGLLNINSSICQLIILF